MKTPKELPVYTVAEAAKTLDVTPATVYRWLDENVLEEVRIEFGKMRLVSAESVKRKLDAGK